MRNLTRSDNAESISTISTCGWRRLMGMFGLIQNFELFTARDTWYYKIYYISVQSIFTHFQFSVSIWVVCIALRKIHFCLEEKEEIIARRQDRRRECNVKRNTAMPDIRAGKGLGRYCGDGAGKRSDLTQIVWRLDGCDRAGESACHWSDWTVTMICDRWGCWTIISRNVNLV